MVITDYEAANDPELAGILRETTCLPTPWLSEGDRLKLHQSMKTALHAYLQKQRDD